MTEIFALSLNQMVQSIQQAHNQLIARQVSFFYLAYETTPEFTPEFIYVLQSRIPDINQVSNTSNFFAAELKSDLERLRV